MTRRNGARRCALALGVTALVATAFAVPAHAAKTVTTRGGDEFVSNQYVRSTLRFAPGRIYVRPNERVTWVHRDQSQDPHTVTVVNRRNMPSTIEQVFQCEICGIAGAHLENPEDPSSPLATRRVEVGRPGLNTQGDSLWFERGQPISARVNAPAGRTIHYLCAIHPWMQGRIVVNRTGRAPRPPRPTVGLTGRPSR